MISGHASPEGTAAVKTRVGDLTFNTLGTTGLTVSGAGFGGYRVGIGTATHAAALAAALTSGINLIDTSANYADGGSEQLVGEVIEKLSHAGRVSRNQLVVVSKGGYLQGRNYALSQERKQAGRPFGDLVEVSDGLEHCLHPDFLDDQIGRSLTRIGLRTLDAYLLHNPEYYLGWAHREGVEPEAMQAEYYRRIAKAFQHLEAEVDRGRIRFYGISSNTFPESADHPEFTALHRAWEIATSFGTGHHFKVIQLPFNLLEPGAATTVNQPGQKTVLDFAREKGLGVLVNRPLNAFIANRLVRLASVEVQGRFDTTTIIARIENLAQSESRLWRKILPGIASIPGGIKVRIKQQGCVAESLTHYWRSFGTYARWREARDGLFMPRLQGVWDYLSQLTEDHPELADWLHDHHQAVDEAFTAVASIYADEAVAVERKITRMVARTDADWSSTGTLSAIAVRALLSTAGVSSVLIGMRRPAYVSEVVDVLREANPQATHRDTWRRIEDEARVLFPA